MDIIPYLVDKLINYIDKKRELSDIQKKKVTYGLRTILYNVEKLLIVLIFSFIFNIEKEVIIMLIPANIIKLSIYGVHAKSSIVCSIVSISILVIGIVIYKNIQFNSAVFIVAIILGIILINLYAPADTAKLPLINKKTRAVLKKRSIITFIVISIIAFIAKEYEVKYFIMYGMMSQIVLTTPLAYKVFNEPYRNYLKYEGRVQ